jgi:putative membrane protein
MKHLRNFIYGIILGITNVIPGVSGGTMAVILNVYDDILYAISWKNFKIPPSTF